MMPDGLEQMRIAIISPYISTSERTEYYQSQQLNLAAELKKAGLDVEIITARRRPDQPLEAVENGVTVIRLPVAGRRFESYFNMPVMRGLRRRLKTGGYQVIQSSDDCAPSTVVSARHCRSGEAALVVYQGVYQYSANRVKRALMRLFDLFAGPVVRRGCSVAVCKTGRAADFLRRKGFGDTRVIPVGVNRSLFYPGDREPGKRFELLAVGNLIGLKNYPLMLETVKRLAAQVRDIRLTIVGSGPERGRIISLARSHGLDEDSFRLLENIPNAVMRQYYCQADLLLLFSDREIFGMVILEAMACGCPVLATPTPGAREVIEDGIDGFITGDTDAGSLAAQTSRILSDPEKLAEMRWRAAEKVERNYGWERIAGRYAELYRELVPSGSTGGPPGLKPWSR